MTWFVVDGMDGSGKSTIAEMIRRRLEAEDRKVLVITHPNRNTPFGRVAEKYLLLESKGAVLISTILYVLDVLNSLRFKRLHGSDYDDIVFVRYSLAAAYMPERLFVKAFRLIEMVLPEPDIRIMVDTDPKIALDRIVSRGEQLEVFETPRRLERTRRRMLMLADSWTKVDNSGSEDESRERVHEILNGIQR